MRTDVEGHRPGIDVRRGHERLPGCYSAPGVPNCAIAIGLTSTRLGTGRRVDTSKVKKLLRRDEIGWREPLPARDDEEGALPARLLCTGSGSACCTWTVGADTFAAYDRPVGERLIMRSSKGAALAPLTGIFAAVLYAAGILISGDTPDSDASGAKVLAYYVSHKSDQELGAVLFGYGSLFLVLFGAALRSGLRRGEREADGPSTLAFGGPS